MEYGLPLLLCLGIAGAMAGAAPQQAAQEPPELVTQEQPALFRTGTNVVTVPVVVRDRQGRAVGTLGKDDFRLSDEGKAQIISRFVVEKHGARVEPANEIAGRAISAPVTAAAPVAASTVPERFLVYLFDDVHLQTIDVAPIREAATRHIEKSLGPGDRAAIFTTSGQNQLDFTSDKEQLRHAISLLAPRPAGDRNIPDDCMSTTYYSAYLIRDMHDQQAYKVLYDQIEACVKPGGNGPVPPIEPLVQAAVAHALEYGDRGTRLGIGAVNAAIQRLSVMPGDRVVVLASPGFFTRLDMVHEKDSVIERAIHAHVTVNALDARSLYADFVDLGTAATRGPASVLIQRTASERERSRVDSMLLADFAYGTGGVLFENRNDLEQGLDRIAAAPEFVYLLTFSPRELKYDGKFHRLKISLANSEGLTVQARLGYWAPNQMMDAAQQASEAIREALFSREEVKELAVELETQFFKTGEDAAKVDIVVHVDAKGMQFLKANGRNRGTLTIVSAIFDQNGNGVAGNRRTLSMNLKDETLARRLETGFTAESTFDVKRGLYQVRVVVRDSEGRQMAARNGVVDIR
jgi:VWFA-related protein